MSEFEENTKSREVAINVVLARRGISRKELSKLAGVCPATITYIFGKSKNKVKMLKMLDSIKCSIEEFEEEERKALV